MMCCSSSSGSVFHRQNRNGHFWDLDSVPFHYSQLRGIHCLRFMDSDGLSEAEAGNVTNGLFCLCRLGEDVKIPLHSALYTELCATLRLGQLCVHQIPPHLEQCDKPKRKRGFVLSSISAKRSTFLQVNFPERLHWKRCLAANTLALSFPVLKDGRIGNWLEARMDYNNNWIFMLRFRRVLDLISFLRQICAYIATLCHSAHSLWR